MSLDLKGRKCQDCNACCRLLGVPSLEKQYFTPCVHQEGRGCRIYTDRPDECRGFRCMWLQGSFRVKDRPDKSGIMVDIQTAHFPKQDGGTVPIPIAKVYETREDGINSPEAIEITRALMGKVVVLLMTPTARQVMGGPKPLVDAVEYAIRAVQMTQSSARVTEEEAVALREEKRRREVSKTISKMKLSHVSLNSDGSFGVGGTVEGEE